MTTDHEVARAPRLPPAAGTRNEPLKILVVDDEPAMVGALGALLGQAGHRIVAAYDGEEALRRFRSDAPDLVLLDLAMPGMDGATVVQRIREESDTPIVVVSGERERTATAELLDAGADDYVRKPFRADELLARVRAVMRRTGARQAASTAIAPRWPSPVGSWTCAATRSAGRARSCRPRRSSFVCCGCWSSASASSWRTATCWTPAGRTCRIPIRSGSSRTSRGFATS